jgi:glucan phosphoethanolaminetransferase (alkaline phosphatase superfamily)
LSRHTAAHGVGILADPVVSGMITLLVTAAFFRRLMTELNLSNTLMIYTSDHGQNFGPGQTHCTVAKEVSPAKQ